jgi:hypothetical protein
MTPDELLARVSPVVASAGSAFYFTDETLARGREIGLDGFRFYFLGRGGVLGDVEATVVASAFGYFEPGLVAHMWNTARARAGVAPRDAARAYFECAHDLGRSALTGMGDAGAYCEAAEAVVTAAEPAGLALFSGMIGEPVPDALAARAMHLTILLRELRGSAHLLAVRASGLSPRTAHYLRRPKDFGMFGWKEGDVPQVGDVERRRLAAADALTDELLRPAFGVLDEDGARALLEGARDVASGLGLAETAVRPRAS